MKIWILAAGFLWAACAPASATPLPRYEPGQAFIYDNGRVEQVRTVGREGIVWSARSGRTYTRRANPVVPIIEWSFRGQTGRREVVGDADRLWPLASGRRVQFRTVNIASDRKGRSRRSLHFWTCTVRSQQRVVVPAGAFEAFPIECDRYSPNSMRVLERLTWHYAPDVEHYIRREARDMGDGTSETYSLYAALPPREANPVRIEALATASLRTTPMSKRGLPATNQ